MSDRVTKERTSPPDAVDIGSLLAGVARAQRRDVLRRMRHLWAVVAGHDLPPPASVFPGEATGLTEVYLATGMGGDPLDKLRWWVDAIPNVVLRVGPAPDGALEIDAVGLLGGQPGHEVRVVLVLPRAGHLLGGTSDTPSRRTSLPELSGLLARLGPVVPDKPGSRSTPASASTVPTVCPSACGCPLTIPLCPR